MRVSNQLIIRILDSRLLDNNAYKKMGMLI